MTPLRIIFAGSGGYGLPSLKLISAHHKVVQVVSQPDRKAGRGKKRAPTPISQYAVDRGLPLSREDDINTLQLRGADLLVVIAFGQKIAPHVVTHGHLGGINVHASRLPKYRGAAPINWAIVRGETVTGNSVIRLAPRMDAGAILGQSELRINKTETAGELHDRLAADGAPLLRKVIDDLAAGRSIETVQDDSLATLAPKLTREQTAIDFTHPADEIARLIRGMYPWPGCTILLHAARFTLARACRGELTSLPPGMTTENGIAAGDGRIVEILELKPQGSRVMPLAAYRNGHPWEGLRVTSVANQTLR